MTALVTGGTGFIGVHLIEQLLARGYRVRCVAKDRLNLHDLRRLDVEIVLGDLLNGLSWDSILKNVDTVFHLAGVTKARKKEEFYAGNYYATSRFLDACVRHAGNLRRFLHVSTLAVTGPSKVGSPHDEEAPYNPLTTYAHSKMMGEREVLRYRDLFPVTVVRPSAVYGPRERDFLQLFQIVRKRLLPLVGFKDKFLSLVHVSDLVKGIISAAESPVAEGNVYFVGSEESYTSRQVGETIAAVIGKHPLKLRLPHWAAYVTGFVSELAGSISNKVPVCNIEKVRDMTQRSWVCDSSKARRDLEYRQDFSLEEGVKNTYEWYRAKGWIN